MALARVGQTEARLAGRARWPFHRHAMFGLAEGLLVAAVAQPLRLGAPMIAVALSLVTVCVFDDRRRHGMFVSGWQAGATRPVTLAMAAVLFVLIAAAAWLRDGDAVQPLGYLLGAIAWAVCTGASLLWQKVYRAELTAGSDR